MAINDTQLLGLKAQLQDTGPGGLGAVTVTSGGGETNTLAAFLALGNAEVIFQKLNDLSVGVQVGAMVGRSAITGQEIRGAIMSSAEYPLQIGGETLAHITFGIPDGANLMDMTDTVLVGAIESLLANFPDALSKFQAKKQVPGTVNDAYYGGLIEESDINALTALV